MPNKFIHEGDMVLKPSILETARTIMKDYIVSCSGMKLRITEIVTKLAKLDDGMKIYEDKFLSTRGAVLRELTCVQGSQPCARQAFLEFTDGGI